MWLTSKSIGFEENRLLPQHGWASSSELRALRAKTDFWRKKEFCSQTAKQKARLQISDSRLWHQLLSWICSSPTDFGLVSPGNHVSHFLKTIVSSFGWRCRGFVVSPLIVQMRKLRLLEGKWLVQDHGCVVCRSIFRSSPDLLTLKRLLLSLSLIILPFLGRHHLPLCFFKVERQSHALPCSFLLQIKPWREPYKQSWQGESLLSLPSIQSSSLCSLFSEIHKRIIPLLLIGMYIHIKEARWVLRVLNVNASLWMILSKPFLTLPKGEERHVREKETPGV